MQRIRPAHSKSARSSPGEKYESTFRLRIGIGTLDHLFGSIAHDSRKAQLRATPRGEPGVYRTKIIRKVLDEACFCTGHDAHGCSLDFDNVGIDELKPQANRVEGAERKRHHIAVRDRTDAEPTIADTERKNGSKSFVCSATDQNANRLHPTSAMPGVTGRLPTVDVRVEINRDATIRLAQCREVRVVELNPCLQFNVSV
jgi:hypothetical protein